ncbi:hypothetical protein K502DRAFT_322698 [Neoconidiobolus thromboides FSU 785]|nr:hypothetical protein K502DRAFT_322698 [Neoconidiobolus thromboides FSU 785]
MDKETKDVEIVSEEDKEVIEIIEEVGRDIIEQKEGCDEGKEAGDLLESRNKYLKIGQYTCIKLQFLYYKTDKSWFFTKNSTDSNTTLSFPIIEQVIILLKPKLKSTLKQYYDNTITTIVEPTLASPEIIITENLVLIYFLTKGYNFNQNQSFYLLMEERMKIQDFRMFEKNVYLMVAPRDDKGDSKRIVNRMLRSVREWLD